MQLTLHYKLFKLSHTSGASWSTGEQFWTDVTGDESCSKEETMCPLGWEWTSEWEIDFNRAVDEDGKKP